MAGTPLATRLKDLPLVMLRQVTKTSVTVWVALKTSVDVTLTLYDRDTEPGRIILSHPDGAKRTPTAVGKNLFILARRTDQENKIPKFAANG